MSKKAIQKQRMMGYFITAAKQIIREKGVQALSARNVGEAAGYSYATIYNYFTDLNELMWYVSLEYLREIVQLLTSFYDSNRQNINSKELIKGSFRTYVNYYLENPTIYQFIFFQQLGSAPQALKNELAKSTLLDHLIQDVQNCVEEGYIQSQDVLIVANLLTAMVHGLLSLYFTGKGQLSQEQLLAQIDENIDYLL